MSSESRPTAYPILRYRDAPAAIDWLERAFGFRRRVVHPAPDGTIGHAELSVGTGIVMLGSATRELPRDEPGDSHSVYVAVDDPDAHHDRAVAAGAEVVRPLVDLDYGSRDYSARDLEGRLWHFGTYRPAPGDPVDG